MKKLLTILGMLFTLSVNAQQINPQTPSMCSGNSQTFVASIPIYNTDTLNFNWYIDGILFGGNNDTVNTGVLNTGNYNILLYVTDSVGNTTQSIGNLAFATVTVNPLPTVTLAPYGPVCLNSSAFNIANTLTESPVGGTFKVNGVITNTFNPTTLGVGSHQVNYIYSNNLGCTDSVSTNIVVNANPTPTITVSPNDTVCLGTQVALFATGGVSYSWSVGGTGSSTTWTPTTTGNQIPSVYVTDVNGCSALEYLPMVVHSNPTILAMGQQDVSCFGGNNGIASISLTPASFPVTYQWNNGGTGNQTNNLIPGTYTVTATNANQCSITGSVTITQPLAAVVVDTLIIANVLCNGGNDGSIGVNASGGMGFYSYSWNDGGVGNPRQNLSAGNYTVTITDGNGCSTTATGTVGEPSILTANASFTSPSCFGGSNGQVWILPNGGIPPYTYAWSNGASTQFVSSLTAGTYNVDVTDANGCVVTTTTTVTQPAAITLSTQITPVTCFGSNNGGIDLTVSGGTSPFTYLWSHGFTGQDPQGLVIGSYAVTVTDANGCIANLNPAIVSQPSVLAVTTNSISATCLVDGSASVSASGGIAPYTYLWSNGGTNPFIIAPAGSYSVVVTDFNGCQQLGITTIGTPVPVGVSASVTPISCYSGTNGAIDLTVTGSSPFTYVWSNGAVTQDLTGLSWGNYNVTVTAANGCTYTQSFTLMQPVPLSAQASATNAQCYGGTGLATVLATGGTGNYSFQWSPSGGNGSTANNLPAGAYTVMVTDANGCTVQANTVISQPSQLLTVISNQTNIACAGNSNGSATVQVVGGTPFPGGSYQFLWSNGSQLNQAFGLTAGSHTVTVTDANGCTATTSATISTAGSTLYANMTSNPSCGNSNTGSVTASVSGGQQPYMYQWSNGASSPSISGLAPGTYSVTIIDANGCSWQGSQQIQGSPAIVVNLTSQVLCEGNNDIVNATFTGGTWPYQFTWTSPLGNIFTTQGINPSQEGIYDLLVVDNFGCTGYGMMPVDLIPCTTTGIDDIDEENINIYPNPISSGGTATVQLPLNIHDVTIELMSITGQILSQEKATGELHKINTSGLAAGTYMVRIASGVEVVTKRLIIQ